MSTSHKNTKTYELSRENELSSSNQQENSDPNKMMNEALRTTENVVETGEIDSFSKLVKLSGEHNTMSIQWNNSINKESSSNNQIVEDNKEMHENTPVSVRKTLNHSLSSKSSKNIRSNDHNRSQRGLPFDFNKENMYIDNLVINDEDSKVKSADINKYSVLTDIQGWKHLSNEIINIKIQDTNKDADLFQINENELEHLESSSENIHNLQHSDTKNDSNKPQITSYVDDMPIKPVTAGCSRENTSSKKNFYSSNSSIKESLRYSTIEDDIQPTTLTKFISNIDLKFQTNQINTRTQNYKTRQEDAYLDDYDGCK